MPIHIRIQSNIHLPTHVQGYWRIHTDAKHTNIYKYICICIYICICTYTHTHIHAHVYVFVCIYVYRHIYIYIYIYICPYIHIHMQMHMHLRKHVHIHMHLHIHVRTRMRTLMPLPSHIQDGYGPEKSSWYLYLAVSSSQAGVGGRWFLCAGRCHTACPRQQSSRPLNGWAAWLTHHKVAQLLPF